ncbi:MAG: hypothetical protein JWO19_2307 [Bryobacterales bacterium]|nr:hypothetical protein [Bryobacterales bacterium]
MTDPSAGPLEHSLWILEFSSSIESEIDPTRVNGDMNERIAGPPGESVARRHGIICIVDQLSCVPRFLEHQGSRRQREFFDAGIVWRQEL